MMERSMARFMWQHRRTIVEPIREMMRAMASIEGTVVIHRRTARKITTVKGARHGMLRRKPMSEKKRSPPSSSVSTKPVKRFLQNSCFPYTVVLW